MRPQGRHRENGAGGIIESERVKAAPGSNDDEVGLELLEDGQNNQAECSLKSSISKEIDHNQQCYEDNRSRNLVLCGASCVFFSWSLLKPIISIARDITREEMMPNKLPGNRRLRSLCLRRGC